MRTLFAFLVLCLALFGVAKAQDPVEVVDGRSEEPWADLSAWATRPAMQQAFAAARAYWRGQDEGYEEDVLVLDTAEGAFTQPGARQQAVLFVMSEWPRCCPKAGLAIVEDGKLVRNLAFVGLAQTLSSVADLDGDGHDELAFVGTFGMGGESSSYLTLAAFGAEGLVVRGGASIAYSTCGSGLEGAGSTAARVLALSGPAFTVERYTLASCEEGATWESDGDPEPLDLDAPSGDAYVNLPLK